MGRMFLLFVITFNSVTAQIDTKLEGITINAPCELEYTRNIDNQNNYSCPFLYNQDEKLDNYSVTISNLQSEMNGLSNASLKEFKDTFFQTIEMNSNRNGESTNYVLLDNGLKAISSISYLTYGDQNFKNISLTFLYRQKSFIVNLTTNNFERKNEISELVKRIVIKSL